VAAMSRVKINTVEVMRDYHHVNTSGSAQSKRTHTSLRNRWSGEGRGEIQTLVEAMMKIVFQPMEYTNQSINLMSQY
jgi:hypothetical protein